MAGRLSIVFVITASLLAVALVVRSSGAQRANLNFTLEDMNGAKVDLARFAGKPIIINLWATWCGPCRLEMPQLVGFADKYKDRGLTVIGVSIDDAPDAIREFAAEYKVTYPMLVGLGQEQFLMSIGYEETLPMSVLIRADGTVADKFVGIKTTEDWERRILGLF